MALNLLAVLQISGAAFLTWALVKLARWLWIYLWLPARFNGESLAKRYGKGSWAFITGASDGLGKAFARELAHCGFNLILAARTQSKLDRLQSELQELGVQVRTVALDLSDSAPHTYQALAAAAEDVDLSVLINCVGTTVHRRYADVPTATLRRLLAVNVSTTAIVTHTLLPGLLRHSSSTGRRAALLNVGSIVGRFYWPGTQIYGACKAFVDHLTVPLAFEYSDQLDVLSFQPTVMATAMAAGTEPAAITIPAELAASAALSHLGHTLSSHGHWRHGLMAALVTILPARVRNAVLLSGALEMGRVEMAKGE
ncbi:SDR family NAD(P)-dependent oxidoreductase [Pseudomonas lurida]|jgi:17beta-estradiol 17-dehydrogenase / very-long-chain 3-oxoacyl-CoA reductase|uniref:SDR family NAD(P)-dependent oxidoreductase n=1 Tax=Pseudomonas TaxID=286 RepID=UPI0015E290A8|nr:MULTISPECIES: SDR family NAD(P)-dependent oxidoreductase [Pseudomonas]MBA1296422.1 SDR family NAD(P)-dependent oxidoreductase [Pseudomonas lurida]WLH39271.1 SDR family NAD(P)-dependent oxidoreductase [Pseudomonas sp. FP2254]